MFFKPFRGEKEEELRCICTLFVPENVERKKSMENKQASNESNKSSHRFEKCRVNLTDMDQCCIGRSFVAQACRKLERVW